MPEVTFSQIGFAVVILLILGQMYVTWAKHRRDEAERIEPKHSPSIDHKIEARSRTIEEKVDREVTQLHGRISKFREEIRSDLDKSSKKVDDAMTEVRTMFHETTKVISKQEGQLEQINQRTHSVERKVDNHIATDSKT